MFVCQTRLKLSCKVNQCKPLPDIGGIHAVQAEAEAQVLLQ